MNKIFLFFLFVLIIQGKTNAQTFGSSCITTQAIKKIYRVDAIRLSIARMKETDNPYKDSIEIPQDVYDSVMRYFTIMHNMQSTLLHDTLRSLFQYDNFTAPLAMYPQAYEGDSTHFNSIFSGYPSMILGDNLFLNFGLEGDSSINWLKEWSLNNYSNTQNININYLISRYQLNINYLGSFSGKQRFKISISGKQNITALKNAFLSIEPSIDNDVYLNSNTYYMGDGNSLLALFNLNGIELHYRNGCGDCPLGCTYGTQWNFFVPYDSCKVEYIGRSSWNSTTLNSSICYRGAITPIEFGNIAATKQGENNQINFTTLSEVNIKGYEIERSSNAKDFVLISIIVANNKNNSSYTVTDKNRLSGNNYYRIKAIENSGAVKYSKIVLVKNDEIQLRIYPNPTKDYITIECKGAMQLLIIDYLGRTIKQMNNITENQTINTKQLQKGFYIVQIINNSGEIKTRKIIVE